MATAPGTDCKLDENKIKGFKHFANKLWNITRFILTMEEGQKDETQKDASIDASGTLYSTAFSAWSPKDAELITEREELIKTITKELEELRYHLASDKIYQYVWSRFADVILEESNIIFKAGTPEEKASRIQFLLHTLRKILVITHPFMPLVTEELWSIIRTEKSFSEISDEDRAKINPADLLMAEKWPTQS